MKKLTLCLTALVAAALFIGPATAGAEDKDEMVVIGFEKQELKAKSKKFFGAMSDAADGFDFWLWFETKFIDITKPTSGSKTWTWRCRGGEKTEGAYSLTAGMRATTGKIPWGTRYVKTPYHLNYYPVPRGGETSVVMMTYGLLSRTPAAYRDWSKYDKLLVDVKLTVPAKIRLWVEDDFLEPPAVRGYDVKAGAWVTLSFDLAQAVRERGLDTKNIVNFWITANTKKGGTIRIDNIRVAKAAVKPKLKVLTDASSMKLPPRTLPETPIIPKRPAIQRDTSAIKPGPPVDAGSGSLVPLGWISVIDNNRIFLAYTVPSGGGPARHVGTRYTLDGGTTWQKADTPVARNIDHGTSAGFDLDLDGCGAAVSSGPACIGANPGPRQLMTKYTFTGNGWKARFPPAPVNADIRHCGSNATMLRILHGPKKGRLWEAQGEIDRMHAISINVSFSDDDGVHWYPWGAGGMIPGSRETEWTTLTYCYQQPRITEYKGHIACAWQDRRGLLWTYFDGKKWAKIMTIDKDKKVTLELNGLESFRVPGCIVSRNDEIFLTAWNVPGVMHFDGTKWHHENKNAGDAGKLTVCGDQLMLFTAGHIPEPPKRKQLTLTRTAPVLCYRRDKDGAWHGPFCLSPGGRVSIFDYRQMAGLVAPRYSPANFVPVAWSNGTMIQMMRVPADIAESPFDLEVTVAAELKPPAVKAAKEGGTTFVTCSTILAVKNIATKKLTCTVTPKGGVNTSAPAPFGTAQTLALEPGDAKDIPLELKAAVTGGAKFLIAPEIRLGKKLCASDKTTVSVVLCPKKEPADFSIPEISGDDGSKAKINTKVKVWRDGKNLRIFARMEEPNTGGLKAAAGRRDAPVWRDDDLEIFIYNGKQYYQLLTNSKGTQCDAMQPDKNAKRSLGWNGAWTVKAEVKGAEKCWTADFTIPFKEIGMTDADTAPGKLIRFNLARSSQASRAGFMAWNPTMTAPHDTDRFGYLVFE